MIVIGGLLHLVIISNKYFTSRLHGQLFRDCQCFALSSLCVLPYPKPFKQSRYSESFVFFNTHPLNQASLFRGFALKKPVTFVTGFVASIELHSNQMWRALREFYSLVSVFEKFHKIKKAGR